MASTSWLVAAAVCQLIIGTVRCQAAPPPPCRTGDNRPGLCVVLPSCSTLQQASQLAVDFSELVALVAYIRQSLCGYDGTSLLVCCTDGVSAASSVALASVIPIAPDVGLQFYEPFTFRPLREPAPLGFTSEQPATVIGASGQVTPTQSPLPPLASLSPPAVVPAAAVDAVCGISNFTQTRVVGGMNAKLNAYPWIAILAYQLAPNMAPKFLCAGSLVSERFILTTAHCVKEELIYARLGEHDLASDADGTNPLNVPIVEKIVHAEYVANAIINDIALLRLGIMVPISAQIRPICLPLGEPLRSADLTGYQPFLAGWGSASYQGAAPSILQEVQIPIVSNAQCQSNYRTLFPQQTFDDRSLCAGEVGRDACQGDSGGPLMLPQQLPADGTFYYVLIGLVSYGYECARDGFPGVYTRVAAFVPWIEEHMK